MSDNVVICGFARSPFTPAKKGDLAKVRPDDLAAEVVKGLIKKYSIKVEDVYQVAQSLPSLRSVIISAVLCLAGLLIPAYSARTH